MFNLAKIGIVEEQRLVHEQSQAFVMRSRHLKQLGLWAATQMGWSGERADRYINRILGIVVSSPEDARVVNASARDFAARGVARDKRAIWHTLARIKETLAVPTGREPASRRSAAAASAGTTRGSRSPFLSNDSGGPAQFSSQHGPPSPRGRG